MKNIIIFFVSMTMVVLLGCWVNNYLFRLSNSNQVYELNTYFSMENNGKKVIHGDNLNYEDCLNKEGNIELKIKIGKHDNRREVFELSVLNNYFQEKFRLKSNSNMMESYRIELEENESEKEFFIILNLNQFQYENRLVFTLRQDTEVYSLENELVRDSNTINVVINICCKKREKKNIEYDVVRAVDERKMQESSVFHISCLNREDKTEIKVQPEEEIKMCLDVGMNQDTEKMIMWCNLNSSQVRIEGSSFLVLNISKGKKGKINFIIVAPKESGLYELEILGQPIDEKNKNIYQIISAKRYTIKVE